MQSRSEYCGKSTHFSETDGLCSTCYEAEDNCQSEVSFIPKEENTLRVLSWNVEYSKFPMKHTSDEAYEWEERVLLMKRFLDIMDPDIVALQELSQRAVRDFKRLFPEYGVFVVNNMTGVPVDLYDDEDVTGIMPGLMFKKELFIPTESGYFTTVNGSSATGGKCTVYLKLKHRLREDVEDFFVTSSHFTFRDDYCRIGSAYQLMHNETELTKDGIYNKLMMGDMNTFDDKDGKEAVDILSEEYDHFIQDDIEHIGEKDSFPGRDWDNYNHPIVDGHLEERLFMDHIFHKLINLVPVRTWSLPVEYLENRNIFTTCETTYELKGLLEPITSRMTVSDHCCIGMDLEYLPKLVVPEWDQN